MIKKTTEQVSFEGLPAGFAKELLSRSIQVAGDMFGPFREITRDRDTFRGVLEKNNLLMSHDTGNDRDRYAVCGVDQANAMLSFPTSGVILSAAFAVEGILSPGENARWTTPQHELVYSLDNINENIGLILDAISKELALERAVAAPHDLVLLNGSFITPFISVMGTLKTAMEEKDSAAGREFIRRLKPSIVSLTKLFDPASKQNWVGIPQHSAKREVMTALDSPADYEGGLLMTILLDPGEYTAPMPVDARDIELIEKMPIRDTSFASVRDSIASAIRKMNVVYYRPHSWTPALRLEVGSSVADDSPRLKQILSNVHVQCRTPGMALPYPLARAEALTRNFSQCIPALRQTLITQITNAHKEDLGDLFALLMFQT